MSASASLSLSIVHENPAAYLALDPRTRRTVERKLLAQLDLLQDQSGASFIEGLQAITSADLLATLGSNEPLSGTETTPLLDAQKLADLMAARVAMLGTSYSLAKESSAPQAPQVPQTRCRYCHEVHCDSTCVELLRDGSSAWLSVVHAGVEWRAKVYMDLEFPSQH